MRHQRVSPFAIDALKDALATVVWYRGDMRSFLGSALSEHPELLAGVDFENNAGHAPPEGAED